MPLRRSKLVFAIALTVSLLVHAWLLAFVPLPAHDLSERTRPEVVAIDLEPPADQPPPSPPAPPPPPPELALGLNAPLPPSLSWLGFTEFQPQFAPPASTDQAAFTDEPVAAAPRDQEAPAETAEASPDPSTPAEHRPAADSTPADDSDATRQDQTAPADLRPREQSPPAPSPKNLAPIDQDEKTAAPDQLDQLPMLEHGRDPIFAAMLTDLLQQIRQQLKESPDPSEQPNDPEKKSEAKKPTAVAPPAPPADSASKVSPSNKPVAPQLAEGASDLGVEADKQSQPTSAIEVPREHWQLGKPLAGMGLELKPHRPTFTLLTMLTAAPGNPLCEMSFSHEGKVEHARIIERSGDSRVDEAILNSLYYWRAAGDELDKLKPGQTLEVPIRIMLTRRK